VKRVCVVCEGQTEETFVREVLAPNFYGLGLNLIPELIETSMGHKGGDLSYDRVKRHLRNTLRQRSQPVVTTLFDLYRLDGGFPGYEESRARQDLAARIEVLNDSLRTDVVAEAGCRAERFIPHIQPYEFEALLFSDVGAVTGLETSWGRARDALIQVRNGAQTPEHINDRPDNKPSAHLMRELTDPRYRKALHGPRAAARIGLEEIEANCDFFAAWLARIRAIAV
jgi:hypothetical protein